ncbi:hypothetical protein PCE1_001990 [Barthelona sp. PCE]
MSESNSPDIEVLHQIPPFSQQHQAAIEENNIAEEFETVLSEVERISSEHNVYVTRMRKTEKRVNVNTALHAKFKNTVSSIRNEVVEIRAAVSDFDSVKQSLLKNLADQKAAIDASKAETLRTVEKYVESTVIPPIDDVKRKYTDIVLRMEANRLKSMNKDGSQQSASVASTIEGAYSMLNNENQTNPEMEKRIARLEEEMKSVAQGMSVMGSCMNRVVSSGEYEVVMKESDSLVSMMKERNEQFLTKLQTLAHHEEVNLSPVGVGEELAKLKTKVNEQLKMTCEALRLLITKVDKISPDTIQIPNLPSPEAVSPSNSVQSVDLAIPYSSEQITKQEVRMSSLESRVESLENVSKQVLSGLHTAVTNQDHQIRELVRVISRFEKRLRTVEGRR